MTTRNEYVESLKSRLDTWNADLAKWEAKAKTARTDVQIEYEMQLDALRKQRDAAKEKLGQLQTSADGAWKDVLAGAEEAWSRMHDAFEKARSHFQK
jgi:chromosome segregation ATPase